MHFPIIFFALLAVGLHSTVTNSATILRKDAASPMERVKGLVDAIQSSAVNPSKKDGRRFKANGKSF